MDSNLITPPDILDNNLHSIVLVNPEQHEVDAVINLCRYAEQAFNVYVYTPNMENLSWLAEAVAASDAVIVNTNSEQYNHLLLLEKTYYYGTKIFVENDRKIIEPLDYFATQFNLK